MSFTQTWTADGELGTVTRYAGLTTATVVETASYTYDANGNITDLQYRSGTVVLQDFAYSYDNANWLSTETDNRRHADHLPLRRRRPAHRRQRTGSRHLQLRCGRQPK